MPKNGNLIKTNLRCPGYTVYLCRLCTTTTTSWVPIEKCNALFSVSVIVTRYMIMNATCGTEKPRSIGRHRKLRKSVMDSEFMKLCIPYSIRYAMSVRLTLTLSPGVG